MTYSTIMVSLASDQRNEHCLKIASDMVGRFDARAVGIAAAEFSSPPFFTSGEQADRLVQQDRSAIKTRLSELEVEFRSAMSKGAKQVEWRVSIESPTRFVAQEARAADIVVIGQRRDNGLGVPLAQVNPSDLVMQIGRPLLIVPETVGWLDLRSVLVAWKDTAEARRAIVDSLPLLRKAKDISIVEVVENGSSREAALRRTGDVVAWLARHDIVASAFVPERSSEWDATIELDRSASNIGAGVIVAGAYGHSRLREWVFGGATQYFANKSERCVLLSR